MNKLKIIIYFFSIFIIINSANSKIEIKYKVDNEIITNLDILEEKGENKERIESERAAIMAEL